MYTLDIFSKMSGASVEAIRGYEKAGLLSPADTAHDTRESIYTSAELITLRIITVMLLRETIGKFTLMVFGTRIQKVNG